jgi:hypothetical protein
MTNRVSDEEFSRLVSALDKVLDRHLGPLGAGRIVKGSVPPNYQIWAPPMDGHIVAYHVLLDDGETLGAINPLRERRKLLEIQRSAGHFAQTLRDVNAHTFDRLATECEALGDPEYEIGDGDGGKNIRKMMSLLRKDPNFWYYFWGAASALDEVMGKIMPGLDDSIDTAPVAGRRNMASVIAIESLRDIWEERKKTPAPMNITDAGPFTDFLIEAFEALGLESNPRAAMDSWRDYRAKYPRRD